MNTYSPFEAAFSELTSQRAQQYYRDFAVEFLVCFGEGLLVLIAGTLRLGQLTREFLETHRGASGTTPVDPEPKQLLLTGFVPVALLPETRVQRPKPNINAVSADRVQRMISTVDESVIGKPKPKTARSGQWHQCNTNIVFGIDGKTVKQLRAMAKEQGYRNTSKLTKAELLGLLA